MMLRRRKRRSSSIVDKIASVIRRHLLFVASLFGICYLQIAANFFVSYVNLQPFSLSSSQSQSKELDQQLSDITSRLVQLERDERGQEGLIEVENDHHHGGTASWFRRLFTSTNDKDHPEPKRISTISPPMHYYEDDGNFVAFTIRDARRTVPTNKIPYGFHTFDIVDLGGGQNDGDSDGFGGDDDMEQFLGKKSRQTKKNKKNHRDTVTTSTKIDYNNQTHTKRATIYHNGRALPASFQSRCQTYSVKCYRTKIASVFEYLLQLKGQSSSSQNSKSSLRGPSSSSNNQQKLNQRRINITPTTIYFFYMEADNSLCVPLTEIRRIAYAYNRYFISTGVGFSGYIMNRTFVQDFVERYEGKDSRSYKKQHNKVARHTRTPKDGKSNDDGGYYLASEYVQKINYTNYNPELHPEVVAGQLLIEKRAWSVTRRYLTSHTVLQNSPRLGGEGMPSLTNLFDGQQHYNSSDVVTDILDEDSRRTTDGTSNGERNPSTTEEVLETESSNGKNNSTTTNDTTTLVDLGIPRHLPRCLEPHRGIWWTPPKSSSSLDAENLQSGSAATRTDGAAVRNDLDHWNFFAYDLCPDSEIFPCKEGQLSELYE